MSGLGSAGRVVEVLCWLWCPFCPSHAQQQSSPAASNTRPSTFQEELDSTDTSVVISSCSLAEARLLLDNFLKASIDKVRGQARPWMCDRVSHSWGGEQGARVGTCWQGHETPA